MAASRTLRRLNPQMASIYVSGAGTDSSDRGRSMWARFGPGLVDPPDGMDRTTTVYRVLYTITKPLLPLLRLIFPDQVSTTRHIGRAVVGDIVLRNKILESKDIRAV